MATYDASGGISARKTKLHCFCSPSALLSTIEFVVGSVVSFARRLLPSKNAAPDLPFSFSNLVTQRALALREFAYKVLK